MKPPKTLATHLAEIWKETEPEFNARIGESGMAAVCGLVFQIRECQRRLAPDVEGLFVAGQANAVEHPAIKVELNAQAALRIWREKFGIARKVSEER